MKRSTDIITINSIGQIPTLEIIRSIPRERTIKLVFEKEIQGIREEIGQNLKAELEGFQVSIHTIEPEINIAKLITDREIEDNQDFFEQCAKDYRLLGKELLQMLINKLDLKLNKDFPLQTFNVLKRDSKSYGNVEGWKYNVHGFHCGFVNIKTKQEIEVPLIFGEEFGDLDPYFFSKFIKSTPKYRPLPVDIFEDYEDGVRINERMLSLGKFEKISSNVGNHYGIVVADRQKVDIKSYLDLEKIFQDQNKKTEITKFDFWKFIGLRRKK